MNYINILGRLTADPDIRITKKDTFYVLFNIAAQESKNRVNFIPCIAFDETAELIGNKLKKGSRIYLVGQLQSSHIDNKYSLIVRVNRFEFAESATKIPESAPEEPKINNDFIEELVDDDELPF